MIQKKLLKIKNVAYSSVARARLPVGTRCVGLFRENQAGTNIPQSTYNPQSTDIQTFSSKYLKYFVPSVNNLMSMFDIF